jgi:predicted ATPase with chaperone activity
MLVKTYGSAVYGVDAITITIEVNVSAGLKYFIVGLPDSAVKESLQRITVSERRSPANTRFSNAAEVLSVSPGT